MSDIVKRLRTRKGFWLNGGAWMMSTAPDTDCAEAADEIERLIKDLKEVREWAKNDIQRLTTEIERLRGIEQLAADASRQERDGLRAEIKRLTALLAWQPINIAPRDGTKSHDEIKQLWEANGRMAEGCESMAAEIKRLQAAIVEIRALNDLMDPEIEETAREALERK